MIARFDCAMLLNRKGRRGMECAHEGMVRTVQDAAVIAQRLVARSAARGDRIIAD